MDTSPSADVVARIRSKRFSGMELHIMAGQTHVFPAGVIQDAVSLDNRHNVAGTVSYQIGGQPGVNVPITPNAGPVAVRDINGQMLAITNNLPNSLYVVF